MWKYIVSFILILIGLFLIKSIDYKKRFIFYQNRLNNADDKLKDSLLKKYESLLKQIKLLKNKKKLNEDDFSDFLEINKKEISSVKLDEEVRKYENKLNIIFQNNNKLVKDSNIKKNINDVEKISITVNALKKYYNSIVNKYNHYVNKFPSKYVAKLNKYKLIDKYEVEEKEKS